MANPEHPRLIIHDFLSPDICKELEFVHKSCCTVGYRPSVFSTTLSHIIATNCAHFIMPFVPIRERLKEKVEEFFGCEFELFVEFTGLISWSKGASIGWHSDDNRTYLKQRDFADVVMYTADVRNIHSVGEITDGERLTLTLWFSRDGSHDEDTKLISFLSQCQVHRSVHEPYSFLPVPASSKMYWFPPDQASTCKTGFNICFARIHALGYDLCSPQDESCFSALDSSNDETLMEPLRLMKEDELFDEEFVNILHILQAVQFHHWKASELHTSEHKPKVNVVLSSQSQREQSKRLKRLFLKDEQLAETLFSCVTRDQCQQHPFSWVNISAAITAWEAYCSKLGEEMLMSLRHWRTHQSIFSVPSSGLDDGTQT